MRCRQWHGSWIIAVDVASPVLIVADAVADLANPVLIVAAHSVVPAAHLMVPNVAVHSADPVVPHTVPNVAAHSVAVSVVPGAKTIP